MPPSALAESKADWLLAPLTKTLPAGHERIRKAEALSRAADLLDLVGIDRRRVRAYPRESPDSPRRVPP